jgi:hypothetical protein
MTMNIHYTSNGHISTSGYTNEPVGMYWSCSCCGRAESIVFPPKYIARILEVPEEDFGTYCNDSVAAEAADLYLAENPDYPIHECECYNSPLGIRKRRLRLQEEINKLEQELQLIDNRIHRLMKRYPSQELYDCYSQYGAIQRQKLDLAAALDALL